MSPLQTQPSIVFLEGILHKGTLARNPRCRRRQQIDEADISTSVVPGGSCTVIHGADVDRHALTSPFII
ncbi:hypothetical protein TNCV_2524831 [Trichonephila clavipes]|nr:hypothetical protein TNCV_2524831 [Trichonephila clavipes]